MQSLLQMIAGVLPYHANVPIAVAKETPLSCLLDGHDNIGICIMHRSMEILLEKAAKLGFAIVGSFRSAPPGTAALGYYVERIAEKGLIAFVFSGSSKKVAPLGEYQALFGSNPITVGLPCKNKPIVIDMATSIMPVFKVLAAYIQHQPLPEGVAFNKNGKGTCDPNAILKEGGALTVFGHEAKTYSLSLLVEALTGPLVGAAFTNIGDTHENWGNLIYALDPELLIGRDAFMESMAVLRLSIKKSATLPEIKEIFLPGEMAEQKMLLALGRGWIEIADDLATALFNTRK